MMNGIMVSLFPLYAKALCLLGIPGICSSMCETQV